MGVQKERNDEIDMQPNVRQKAHPSIAPRKRERQNIHKSLKNSREEQMIPRRINKKAVETTDEREKEHKMWCEMMQCVRRRPDMGNGKKGGC
jgi:hypothetical protein